MRKAVLLSAIFISGAISASSAVDVLPSCNTGGYSIFDENQCTPQQQPQQQPQPQPQPQPQQQQQPQPQPQPQQVKEEEPVVPVQKKAIIEKKVRYFVDWGEYKNKSPQELLAIIKNLLNNQSPSVTQPATAPVGCCYGKLVKPPIFEEVIIKYVKKDGSYNVKTSAAQFKEVEKKILVRPAYHKIEVIPAKYKTVEEKVMIVPPRTIWKYHNGIVCRAEVPAEYVTLTRKVMVEPPKCKKILVPAEYKVIKVKQLVKDATCQKQPVPPKYDVVKKVFEVKGPKVIWDAVLCNINLKPEDIKLIQEKLNELGYYNGPINGVLDDNTMAAVVKFQVDHNLPAGNISIQTLEALGLQNIAQSYLKCEIKNLK